jgi:hypothetical protein
MHVLTEPIMRAGFTTGTVKHGLDRLPGHPTLALICA